MKVDTDCARAIGTAIGLAVVIVFLLTACAGPLDTDFRRKVSSVDVTGSAAGTVSVEVDFRDPSKDGLSK